MNKRHLVILERAFDAEIDGALNNNPGLLQTKSGIAKKLVEEGYLQEVRARIGSAYQGSTAIGAIPVIVKGYALTERGRITYCSSCVDCSEPG